MTAAYLALVTALVCMAMWQKRDWCAAIMGVGLLASILVMLASPASPLPHVAAIDAMVCLAMAAIWAEYGSMRARAIGFIGLAKTGVTATTYAIDAYTFNLDYALFIDAAFVAQVIVAGGWFDAMANRLDDSIARTLPRFHRLLHDGVR